MTAEVSLLRVGAVLRGLNHEILLELSTASADELGSFLSGAAVTVDDSTSQTFLHEAYRLQTLEQLRAERPDDEIELHSRAFEYYLRHLDSAPLGHESEIECFYHLDQLYALHAARDQWRAIELLVEAARRAGANLPEHLYSIAFYDACIATHQQLYEQAHATFTVLLEQPHLSGFMRCRALNEWANTFFYQTQYDRALELYGQVIQTATDVGNVSYQGIASLNMGMIYNELKFYDRALEMTSHALAAFHALGDRKREAIALYELGNSALQLGRWQLAADHFAEAVQLMGSQNLLSRLPYVLWGQGLLYHLAGDERASEAAYLRALELAEQPVIINLPLADDILWQLGFLYYTQDRFDDALALYDRAIELAEQLGRAHWLSLLHYQRGNVLLQLGRVEETFAEYEQAIASIEALRGATETEEIKIGLLGTTQQVYEAMVLLCIEHGREREAFEYAERARSRAFLDTLLVKSPELAPNVEQTVVTLDEVQRTLPPNALLLEFFTAGVLPRGEHLINRLPPENQRLREHLVQPPAVWVFAVARDALAVRRIQLDPNTLRPLPNDPGPGRRLLLNRRLLQRLRQQLLGPVEQLLAGRDTLFVLPHGPLHYVPWAALPDAEGRFLVQTGAPALAMAPSATVLLRACLRPRRTAQGGSLALGYNDRGERELVAAEAEARAVARLLGGDVWSGPEPKGSRLLAFDRELRRLHIAGHAVYRPDDPLGSELRLGEEDRLTAREIIAGLELDADLVTLSACTTGLSHVVPGDELLGLQRAFLYAGARAVLCTLWEATDIATMLVMEHFYAALNRGIPAAAALRDAQVALRELSGGGLERTLLRWRDDDPDRAALFADLLPLARAQPDAYPLSDPFYWAPFMLIGNPG